ncbi:MAG: hypothetical protein JXR96_04685 [Deltaproteobacteria bacterium]|nr:hypothetical protein [Deltaproteobacteria bacterium]
MPQPCARIGRSGRIAALLAVSFTCSLWAFQLRARAGQLAIEIELPDEERLIAPGKRIEVTIRAVEQESKRGVAGLELQLDASNGLIGPATDRGGGRYTAEYTMPAKRHPQVVLLAAKAPGAPPAWKVLKLRSRVELPVNTSKPHVQVTLRLGGRSYGPARSDARGRVKIPVEVRPGETEALAVGVDEFGNRTERRVAIPVPDTPSVVGFAERKRLAADGADRSALYIVAVQPDGRPNDKLKLIAFRTSGSVSAARRIAPGLYRLDFTAPSGLGRERVSITLAEKGQVKLNRRRFTFSLTAGQPQRIEIQAEPAELFADGKSTARLVATVTDRAGNRLENTAPRFVCEHGFPEPTRELGDGRYESIYQAPIHKQGPAGCRAELQRADGTPLRADFDLLLRPPRPDKLVLRIEPKRLPMDGRSHATIQIEVLDHYGNPMEGVALAASASLGGLDPVSEEGQGRYHVSYTAPRGSEDSRVRIELRSGEGPESVRETIVLELDGIEPPPPPLPWISIGPAAALMTNFGRLLYGGVNLDAALRIPWLRGYLYLDIELGYRIGRKENESDVRDLRLDTCVETWPLYASLWFKPWPHARITPVIILGGGPVFAQWSLKGSDGSSERQHDLLLGALAGLGGELALGAGALFVQLRYTYAFLRDQADARQPDPAHGSSIKGSVGGLDATLGYRVFF